MFLFPFDPFWGHYLLLRWFGQNQLRPGVFTRIAGKTKAFLTYIAQVMIMPCVVVHMISQRTFSPVTIPAEFVAMWAINAGLEVCEDQVCVQWCAASDVAALC